MTDAVDPAYQQRECTGAQHGARQIEAMRRGRGAGQEPQRHKERGEPDRHVDREQPRPGSDREYCSGNTGARGRGYRYRHGSHRDATAQLLPRISKTHESSVDTHHAGRADALQGAAYRQHCE